MALLASTVEQCLGNHGVMAVGCAGRFLGFSFGLVAGFGLEPTLEVLAAFLLELVNVAASSGPGSAWAVGPIERGQAREGVATGGAAAAEVWAMVFDIMLLGVVDRIDSDESRPIFLSFETIVVRVAIRLGRHVLDRRGRL